MSRRQQLNAFIQLDARKCQACWHCVDACRRNAIGKVSIFWHKHAVLRGNETCVGCFKCVEVCQPGALQRRVAP